jgi:hypothetical protein
MKGDISYSECEMSDEQFNVCKDIRQEEEDSREKNVRNRRKRRERDKRVVHHVVHIQDIFKSRV